MPKIGTGTGPGGPLEELDKAKKMKETTSAMERVMGRMVGEMEKNKLGKRNLVSNPKAIAESEQMNPNFAADFPMLVNENEREA